MADGLNILNAKLKLLNGPEKIKNDIICLFKTFEKTPIEYVKLMKYKI